MYIYLYVKTHQKTGLKYFGKTTNKNPHKYRGSGKYWRNHLKKHGNHVDTEILGYFTENEVESIALKFSHDNNIVESSDWANLVEENGFDGLSKGFTHSDETRKKISDSLIGFTHSDETRKKISDSRKGKPRSAETRKKIGDYHKGKVPWNKGKKCSPLSEEHKAKISASRRGKKCIAESY